MHMMMHGLQHMCMHALTSRMLCVCVCVCVCVRARARAHALSSPPRWRGDRRQDKKITSFQPAWVVRCSTQHQGQLPAS